MKNTEGNHHDYEHCSSKNIYHVKNILSKGLPLNMDPYQIDDPCPISTSPMTAALGATNTSLWILGSFSKMFMIVRCLETENSIQKGNQPVSN
jgi:hypothetical protein